MKVSISYDNMDAPDILVCGKDNNARFGRLSRLFLKYYFLKKLPIVEKCLLHLKSHLLCYFPIFNVNPLLFDAYMCNISLLSTRRKYLFP